MCVKNTFFATEKTKKSWTKKESDGPDGKTVVITDHLPSRCQCRRVLRGKLLPLVNGPVTRMAGLTFTIAIYSLPGLAAGTLRVYPVLALQKKKRS